MDMRNWVMGINQTFQIEQNPVLLIQTLPTLLPSLSVTYNVSPV